MWKEVQMGRGGWLLFCSASSVQKQMAAWFFTVSDCSSFWHVKIFHFPKLRNGAFCVLWPRFKNFVDG